MEKNWLIRTVQNQVLGPVSCDKVKDFVRKGSLRPQDEICSGNGFWFRIEERDLLEKYLFEGEKQPFNPVSEVQPSLSGSQGQAAQTMVIDLNAINLNAEEKDNLEHSDDPEKVEQKNIKYPSGQDLQYPNMDSTNTTDQDLELPQDDDIALELEDTNEK